MLMLKEKALLCVLQGDRQLTEYQGPTGTAGRRFGQWQNSLMNSKDSTEHPEVRSRRVLLLCWPLISLIVLIATVPIWSSLVVLARG